MENKDKVKVISTVKNKVVVTSADLHFSRTWQKAGAVVTIPRETLDELMYDIGFANMIKEGILYIEDMEVKKDIGIEPEDAETPTIIFMNDKELNRFWKIMPLSQFKVEVKKLTKQ